jgi:hypothetical protein
MSSLLDEAIVDAKALREAVLKNAEASLLEAYAPKIEEAVVKLLEQDPAAGMPVGPMDIGAPPPDIGAAPGGLGTAPAPQDEETGATFSAGEEEELDIGYGALTDLDDDSTLDDKVVVDVSRGELQAMLESITRDIEALEEEAGLDYPEGPGDKEIEIDEELLETFANDPKLDADGDDVPKWADKDDSDEDVKESLEITEDNIDDIVESLMVDLMPTKSGWAGTPESVMQHNERVGRCHGTV